MPNENDYGVNKVATDLWMVVEMPLELGTEEEAINNLSFDQAIIISEYLTAQQGEEFAPGRPIRKPRP